MISQPVLEGDKVMLIRVVFNVFIPKKMILHHFSQAKKYQGSYFKGRRRSGSVLFFLSSMESDYL